MCLSARMEDKETKKWLEKQPETLILYKIVTKKGNGRYYPLFHYDKKPFNKQNRLSSGQLKSRCLTTISVRDWNVTKWLPYVPNFHFFILKKGAKSYAWAGRRVTVKCKVRKKDITAVGWQDCNPSTRDKVIVATAFEIIEEVECV